MSRSWCLPQVSPICLLALMECQESRWQVLILLTLETQPWISLWHTASAQGTTPPLGEGHNGSDEGALPP